ncbi:MAG: hypothetical protein IPN76_09870 [Saprospiraceae bacterium]|nr:hypothetical protein [Saprospiraceae bacterium]
MKKILWIFSSAILLSTAILSTGCGDEGTDDPKLTPVVVITDGPDPATVVEDAGTIVTVTVEATKGTDALKSVTVYEGNTKVSIDDLTIDGVDAVANPILITSPTDVMTWDIGVHVHAAAGTATYRVVVGDDGGLEDEASFDVTVEAAIENTLTGVLLNAAGPAGTGGLDLDTGIGTGSSAVESELRDMGIDSIAGSGDNWRRRIGGINGANIRYAGNGTVEFGDVASKEAIVALYDGADELQAASNYTAAGDGIDKWGNYKVSDTVQIGDVFVVYKSSTEVYYLVEVTDIEENTVLGTNTDNYTLSIKY